MSENTIDVTDASFDMDVLASEKVVVVDFWAPWCAPCKMLTPVLDEIAQENSDALTVAKVNIDSNEATMARFNVKSIPTMLVFRGGEVVHTILGGKPKEDLLGELAAHLEDSPLA